MADKEPPPPRATAFFKLINFELFVKPRTWVSAIGTGAAIGAAYYLYVEGQRWEEGKEQREQDQRRKEEELERRRQNVETNPWVLRMRENEKRMEEQLKQKEPR
jgi:hypothetical protein